jgi:hypothetical protein
MSSRYKVAKCFALSCPHGPKAQSVLPVAQNEGFRQIIFLTDLEANVGFSLAENDNGINNVLMYSSCKA